MTSSLKDLLSDGALWHGSADSMPGVNTQPQGRSSQSRRRSVLAARFGIPEIDNALPDAGLAFGRVHQLSCEDAFTDQTRHRWNAPLFMISALLGSTLGIQPWMQNPLAHRKYLIAWIGRRCWPTPQLLQQLVTWQVESLTGGERSWPWQQYCLFIDPPTKEARLWAIAQALRNRSVIAVVADGSGFSLTAMRRLQIAAEIGGSLGIITRPAWEQVLPSAASSKWHLAPAPSLNRHLCWRLELLKQKGSVKMPAVARSGANGTLPRSSFATPTSSGFGNFRSPEIEQATSVCSSSSMAVKWYIEWNEELYDGKGALCLADPEQGQQSRNDFAAAAHRQVA